MRWAVTLHRRLGVWGGLIVVLAGLSGSAVVFRDAVERGANGMPANVETKGRSALPLQAVYERVISANPGQTVLIWNLPVEHSGIHQVVLSDGRFVAIDPFTGSILGQLRGQKSWMTWASRLHFALLIDRRAAGIGAVLMVLLAFSGVTAWMRGSRSWHTRLGLLSSPILLLFGISGAWFIWARPEGLVAPTVSGTAAPMRNLEFLVATAQLAANGARPTYVTLPSKWQGSVSVRLREAGQLRATGSTTVHLHPATGEILRIDRFAEASRKVWWYTTLSALHFGEFGGTAVRVVWVGLGLSPLVLWLSGIRWRRRNRNS